MNTTCNISLKQHTLWGQLLTSAGTVAAMYITSNRGDFNPSVEQGACG
jgi:hypothetical protein